MATLFKSVIPDELLPIVERWTGNMRFSYRDLKMSIEFPAESDEDASVDGGWRRMDQIMKRIEIKHFSLRQGVVGMLLLGCSLNGVSQEPAPPPSASPKLVAGKPTAGGSDALFRYVEAPDPAYSWKIVKRVPGEKSTTFVVRLTSQSWRTKDDVDRPLWEHWLIIIQPAKPASDQAFLLIGGGGHGGDPPERPDSVSQRIAEATNSVVAELKMVPYQPIVFHNDGVPRYEDDLIGYAWDQYIKTSDPTWLPRLPMVKSAVRAMDCVQELLAGKDGGGLQIDKFVVAGASKRGWTTWMTGAADPRVTAIVPIVIDVLNVEPSILHHAAVYGFWSEAIGNYVQHDITSRWSNPRTREIYEIVDPYYHLDRLKMPKYIVNASGDQFFCPDSSQFYFDALQGEKHLRYVPNTDHSLRNSDAVESIAAFYQMVLSGTPRPQFSWTFDDDGSIRVTTKNKPLEVRVWWATNPKARDFRLKTIGPAFHSRVLKERGDGLYVGAIDSPQEGWTAFFVELTYESGAPVPLKLTTAVRITPDTLPHQGIDPAVTPYEPDVAASK